MGNLEGLVREDSGSRKSDRGREGRGMARAARLQPDSNLANPIPPGMPRTERKSIALAGFSSYGRRAQFAAYIDDGG